MRLLSFTLLLFLLPIHLSAQQAKDLCRGSWKSNRELTIKSIKLKKEVRPELRQRLDDLFGKMIVTYTGNEITAHTAATKESAKWSFTSAYTVVMATDTKLIFRSQNAQTKAMENNTITFEGPDRYWVSIDVPGIMEGREYFDRVQTDERGANANARPASGRGSSPTAGDK